MRGAWIEIMMECTGIRLTTSLPLRGAWIEIQFSVSNIVAMMSLPLRGAWIEILDIIAPIMKTRIVAPLAGGVD